MVPVHHEAPVVEVPVPVQHSAPVHMPLTHEAPALHDVSVRAVAREEDLHKEAVHRSSASEHHEAPKLLLMHKEPVTVK